MPQIRLDYISETVMIPHEEAGSSEQQETGGEKTASQTWWWLDVEGSFCLFVNANWQPKLL